MKEDIAEVLITEEAIRAKVKELGSQISRDYRGKDLHLVAILKGAFVFLADLARSITIPLTIDFMVASSYVAAHSSGEVRIIKDLDVGISDRDVVIVEDIIDNGVTLHYLVNSLSLRQPASLKICTFLDKPGNRVMPIYPHYNGFSLPNKFVVGYGLDYNQRYRNLPYVAALKEEIYSTSTTAPTSGVESRTKNVL